MTDLSRVLVVEDEIILLLSLIDDLEDLGLDAVPVTSARGAMSLLDQVDALVTDVELPGNYTGLQLARFAATARPGMPIVVVSGGVTPKADDLPVGAVFIPKPYSTATIVAALERQVVARAA
ncbi:Response regulator receiver domain-containing protein [Devosia lucknowensis]|uniref:Response regulator receiver domain-containing protein n=1 Tax=Devosia lucknowensis TaxID=1096929 RepID=A0A1Y6F5Y3_9HYPH|nr:response regulator [Devosia lucknowensis]SMQ70285.1 Response regulator receiver domain-containing protein [Devosia lucknowensis]